MPLVSHIEPSDDRNITPENAIVLTGILMLLVITLQLFRLFLYLLREYTVNIHLLFLH